MSHINFKTLEAKNFRSIDNMGLKVDFKSGKTTLVASTDNGSGKSSIWRDALFYALFDKPYAKGQSKTQLINSRSGNKLYVKLEFEKGGIDYIIERGQKPSVFEITVDGEKLNKEAVDFQKTLLDILGADEKLFSNSIILGADKFVPFTNMGAEERRRFGDQMLDLIVITKMSALNKERMKEVNQNITSTNQNLSILETRQTGIEAIISAKKANSVDLQNRIQEDINSLESDKAAYEHDKNVAESDVSSLEEYVEEKKAAKAQQEQVLLEKYKPLIEEARKGIAEAENLSADELTVCVNNLQDSLNQCMMSITKEEKTIAEQRKLFKEQFDTRQKYEDMVLALKNKLSELKEPNKDEPCSHCGGVVGEQYYQKHLDEYNTKRQKLEDGIKAAEMKVQEGANLDSQFAQWEEHCENDLEGYRKEQNQLSEELNDAKVKRGTFESDRHKKISDAKHKLSQVQAELTRETQEIINPLTQELNKIISDLGYKRQDVERLNGLMGKLHQNILSKQQQLESTKNNSSYSTEEADLVECQNEIHEQKNILDECYKKQAIANLLTQSLKDDGIKAKLVENYLPYINDRINFYLEKMNFFVRIELNREYELEMFAPERKGQNIHCLSAGQQKRIDLSVLLAWRDLARQASTNSCNILIMDELLEAMSESGIIDFMEMWRTIEESKYTNLVVITQRKAEFEPLFDECKMYKLVDLATVEIENE